MTITAQTVGTERSHTMTATSLEQAYAAHHAGAVRLAYLLCGDRDSAEDIAADVWVKVHRRLQTSPVDNIGAYVRRAVINHVNSGFRRRGLARREAARLRGDERGQPSIDQQVADREAVVGALAQLPYRTRAAVVLRYYEDLSVADTAAALGVSEGTIKSSVSRGLSALRIILEGSA
ncbi:MAG: SigE family RNA polymerase sigma factor [Euzebya sp.]